MKILYDNQIFKIQRFGGISRYYTELFNGFNKSSEIEVLPKQFHSDNKHLQLSGLTYSHPLLNRYNFRGKLRIQNYLSKKHDENLIKLMKTSDFDMFHPTYYDPGFMSLLPAGKPFVITVYDMIHELYYNDHLEKISLETKAKRELLPKAAHIIAISQNTKDDILRFIPDINPDKISVVYLGSSMTPVEQKSPSPLSEKYILFVGNRGYYKNFLWFSTAIADLLKTSDIKVLCAGGGYLTDYEILHLQKLGIADQVIYSDIKSDDELALIYQNAACFIFPSLFEGFGIPILEAFSCRCPVLLPKSSCFPEIAGDAALYYEPDNAENMVAQIERICSDHNLSETLRRLGQERLELFSWEKTVEDHKRIYLSLEKTLSA